MPMYDLQCPECRSVTSRFRRIKDRNDPLECACGGAMQIAILTAPAAFVQPECHYVCPATGEQVTSWRQRKNTLAKNDLVPADPDRDAESRKKRLEAKQKRAEIAQTYLPTDLRKQLTDIGKSGTEPLDRFTL